MKPLPAFKRLKAEVIADLCERVRAGDLDARNALIQANMRLVAQIATRYAKAAGRLDLLDDCIQEAVIGSTGRGGLLRAIELYDETQGTAFSTFASHWIRDAVTALLRSQHATASKNVSARRSRIRRAHDELVTRLGRTPTTHEVRDRLIASGCKHHSSLRLETIERAIGLHLHEISFEEIEAAAADTGIGGEVLRDPKAPDEDSLLDDIDRRNRRRAVGFRCQSV